MENVNLISIEILVVQILLVVTLVATVTRRIRLPYTVALVLAGLALTLQKSLRIELTPELVLSFFLPPLVFEAAFHLKREDVRRDIVALATLAVPGVVIGTAITAAILASTGVLSLPLAFLFGAITSATDPVAVVALFRVMGAPRRLTTLLEGESLLNDGTAIVVFSLVLSVVMGHSSTPADVLVEFLRVSLIGIFIGYGLGWLAAQMFNAIDDYLVETTITTVLAYGSYLLAEHFHVSGVLAVVTAGVVSGNVGTRGMSPTTRVVLFSFWEYVAFIANSFVFLLLGLSVNVDQLVRHAPAVGIAIIAVLVSRVLTVYGIGALLRLLRRRSAIPATYLHTMIWGGLRGAVSLALALSLPFVLTARSQLLAMTFGVVLFTLLVQATTVAPLLRRLRLSKGNPFSQLYERLQAEILSLRAARRHLDQLHEVGGLLPSAWEKARGEVVERETQAVTRMNELLAADVTLVRQVTTLAKREALQAQRASLEAMGREGLLSNAVLDDLLTEVDQRLNA